MTSATEWSRILSTFSQTMPILNRSFCTYISQIKVCFVFVNVDLYSFLHFTLGITELMKMLGDLWQRRAPGLNLPKTCNLI